MNFIIEIERKYIFSTFILQQILMMSDEKYCILCIIYAGSVPLIVHKNH